MMCLEGMVTGVCCKGERGGQWEQGHKADICDKGNSQVCKAWRGIAWHNRAM